MQEELAQKSSLVTWEGDYYLRRLICIKSVAFSNPIISNLHQIKMKSAHSLFRMGEAVTGIPFRYKADTADQIYLGSSRLQFRMKSNLHT